MDHNLLIEEMNLTAQMSKTERIYLAKKNRMRQLENFKKWDQQEGDFIDYDEGIRKTKIQFSLEVLFFEAVTSGNLHELSLLLEEDIDVNNRNYEGLTPLHQSCIDGYYEIVYLLLQRGAEVNATDMDGWTPLHAAATCGHKNIAKLLVQNGADLLAVNVDENMPFEITEDEDVLNFLQSEMVYQGITTQMINEKRHVTYSILQKDIINVLNAGGNLDDPITDDGATFLHVAIGYFYNKLVEILLENGASSNTTDNEGWHPIHVAAYWGNEEAFKILVKKYNVDIEVKTFAGETPEELCDNQDLKIYINGMLKRKSSLQNSVLTYNYIEIDFIDIHNTMEEQSKLPILQQPLFNPKANELASDKRTSFREAKKSAPNIKTLSSGLLKDGLSDDNHDNAKPDIDESNESTTKIMGNEPDCTKSTVVNADNQTENQRSFTNKENTIIAKLKNGQNTEVESKIIIECNNNNITTQENNSNNAKSVNNTHKNYDMPNLTQNTINNSSPNSSLPLSSSSPLQNTLSSLKKQRIEQRQLNQSTKRFSDIETNSEQDTINRPDPNNSDIMYRFKQSETQYNYISIVKKKKCCRVM